MDSLHGCSATRYYIGNFSEIRFRIYSSDPVDPTLLRIATSRLRELDVLATFDRFSGRIWEFDGPSQGPKHHSQPGLVALHSGRCKASDLLNALAKSPPPYQRPDDRKISTAAETEKPQQAKPRPTALDLYEQFVKANLARLSVRLARSKRCIPLNLCTFLVPTFPSGTRGTAAKAQSQYRLESVYLTLAEDGSLLFNSRVHEPYFLRKMALPTNGAMPRQGSTVIIAPGGKSATILAHANASPGSARTLLQGKAWRALVMSHLKESGISLTDSPSAWTKLSLGGDWQTTDTLRPTNGPGRCDAAVEWPADLCFYRHPLDDVAKRDKAGLGQVQYERPDCQLDPLEFALKWLDEASMRQGDAWMNHHVSVPDRGVSTPLKIEVLDYFAGSPIDLHTTSTTEDQNVYPTPSESLQAQATPGAIIFDAGLAPGTSHVAEIKLVDSDRSYGATGNMDDDATNAIEVGEDVIGLDDITMYLNDHDKTVDFDIGPGTQKEEEILSDSPIRDIISTPGAIADSETALNVSAAPDATSTKVFASGPVYSGSRKDGAIAGESHTNPDFDTAPVEKHNSTLPSVPTRSRNPTDRQSLGRLDFDSTIKFSDRKYHADGRFAASPLHRRLAWSKPTSIPRPVRQEDSDDDSRSEGSSTRPGADDQSGSDPSSTRSPPDVPQSLGDLDGDPTRKQGQIHLLATAILEELLAETFSSEDAIPAVGVVLRTGINVVRKTNLILSPEDKVGFAQLITRSAAFNSWSIPKSLTWGATGPIDTLEKVLTHEASLATAQTFVVTGNASHSFAIEPTLVGVRRNDEKWELSCSALAFWDALGLEPAHGLKDVAACCLFPRSYGLEPSCRRFLEAMSETWDALRFGTHEPALNTDEGLLSLPFDDRNVLANVVNLASDVWEELHTIITNYEAGHVAVVLYIVTASSDLGALTRLCSSLQILVQPWISALSSTEPVVIFQQVPIEALVSHEYAIIFDRARAAALAHEVYDKIPSFQQETRVEDLSIPMAASIVLASTPTVDVDFKLTNIPSASVLLENSPIHVAYCIDEDNEWVTTAWIDSSGIHQHLASYRITASITFRDVLVEIWDTTCEIIGHRKVHWRVFVAKDTPFAPLEEETWLSVAKSHGNALTLHLLSLSASSKISAHSLSPESLSSMKADAASPALFRAGPSTPIITPYQPATPSVSSPTVPPTPSAGPPGTSAFAFSDSSASMDVDADKRLIDKTEESWGLILRHVRNRSHTQTQYRPALASGCLLKRTGTESGDPLAGLDVDLVGVWKAGEVWARSPGKEDADRLLREILVMYRALATLARVRGLQGARTVWPWHILAARKGVEGVAMAFERVTVI